MAAADHHPSKPPLYWALVAICGVLLLAVVSGVVMVLTSTEDEQLRAVAAGQHLTINTKNGEVVGTMRTLKAPEPAAEKQPETPEGKEQKPATSPAAIAKPAFDVADDEPEANVGTQGDQAPAADLKASLIASEEEAAATIHVNPVTAVSLAPAPVEGLTEQTAAGMVPKKQGDQLPRLAYARPFDAKNTQPRIALAVYDLGEQIAATEQAIALPADVSLVISPYSSHAAEWTQSARNMGHEVWLMLPVQPQGFPANDPGPKSLLVGLSEQENIERLQQTLVQAVGYVGVALPANEAFSDQPVKLEAVVQSLEARGLGVLAARTVEKTQSAKLLENRASGRRVADRVVDATLTPEAIAAELAKLETIAKEKGTSVGVAHPYPISLKAIETWAQGLEAKGIVLAPLSAVMKAQE